MQRVDASLDAGMAILEESIPRLVSTLHIFGAPWIDLDLPAGVADCETYAVNSATYPPEEDGLSIQNVSGTRYLDRFEQHDGAWKIVRRSNRRVWAHNLPDTMEPSMPGSSR